MVNSMEGTPRCRGGGHVCIWCTLEKHRHWSHTPSPGSGYCAHSRCVFFYSCVGVVHDGVCVCVCVEEGAMGLGGMVGYMMVGYHHQQRVQLTHLDNYTQYKIPPHHSSQHYDNIHHKSTASITAYCTHGVNPEKNCT